MIVEMTGVFTAAIHSGAGWLYSSAGTSVESNRRGPGVVTASCRHHALTLRVEGAFTRSNCAGPQAKIFKVVVSRGRSRRQS